MSSKRAYTIIRGFVNREWERLFDTEDESAVNEVLQEWNGVKQIDSKTIELPIVAKSNEESNRKDAPNNPTSTLSALDQARIVLGVSKSSSLTDIHKAYLSLIDRCNPTRFPDRSQEAFRATQIRIKVLEAYRVLTAQADSIDLRFQSIEID